MELKIIFNLNTILEIVGEREQKENFSNNKQKEDFKENIIFNIQEKKVENDQNSSDQIKIEESNILVSQKAHEGYSEKGSEIIFNPSGLKENQEEHKILAANSNLSIKEEGLAY